MEVSWLPTNLSKLPISKYPKPPPPSNGVNRPFGAFYMGDGGSHSVFMHVHQALLLSCVLAPESDFNSKKISKFLLTLCPYSLFVTILGVFVFAFSFCGESIREPVCGKPIVSLSERCAHAIFFNYLRVCFMHYSPLILNSSACITQHIICHSIFVEFIG